MTTAHAILSAAQSHMQDRADTYDKPEGERSMGATVDAFNAVTGHHLTEEQGWLFMALLKAVRSQQGGYRADSYEDGAAYFALAGESAARDRDKPVIQELYSGVCTQEEISGAAFKQPYHDTVLRGHELYSEEDEKRMDVVGTNGNDGTHYWQINRGVRPASPAVLA